MTPVVFAFPGNEAMADALSARLSAERGACTVRRFPDDESYVRVETAVSGRDAILVCTLDRPDGRIAQLLLLASAARESGALRVGLVAPYLAYMRQDARFTPGECVSAKVFAQWIELHFDWLVTVDPHLHRFAHLAELYSIPARAAHSAPVIAAWLRENVPAPVLVGPDQESAQWVEEVASLAGVPSIVLAKRRRGDRDVEVSVPEPAKLAGRTPVLVDDIVSTARTMIAAVRHLREAGLAPPVCIAVHAVFAGDALHALHAAGAGRVVSCDTIPHPTNAIALEGVLCASVAGLLGNGASPAIDGKAAV
ncbi:MAG: ribose-phosphate pyrophosphokinase [Proteobacteria bacterium]|nr:ribose-phosphate pyrophosphokinase [Pseudomonadota bacterium]